MIDDEIGTTKCVPSVVEDVGVFIVWKCVCEGASKSKLPGLFHLAAPFRQSGQTKFTPTGYRTGTRLRIRSFFRNHENPTIVAKYDWEKIEVYLHLHPLYQVSVHTYQIRFHPRSQSF